jgi:hypothetical protein
VSSLSTSSTTARTLAAYAKFVDGVVRAGRVEVAGVERDEMRELVGELWTLADGYDGEEGSGGEEEGRGEDED